MTESAEQKAIYAMVVKATTDAIDANAMIQDMHNKVSMLTTWLTTNAAVPAVVADTPTPEQVRQDAIDTKTAEFTALGIPEASAHRQQVRHS